MKNFNQNENDTFESPEDVTYYQVHVVIDWHFFIESKCVQMSILIEILIKE
jgi:hypothetical protein